jgi:hypothetical protein
VVLPAPRYPVSTVTGICEGAGEESDMTSLRGWMRRPYPN